MPEWLKDAALFESPISAGTMSARLAIAALFGLIIAFIYRLSHGRLARDSSTLFGTLVLLTILLAMVTMVIGDSVARAFGLVGALSIVRFRTVVDDTRDTAFVIFAVVVGMAIGTGLVLVAAIGVPITAAAAFALSSRILGPRGTPGAPVSGTLTVRMGVGHASSALDALLASRTRAWKLLGVATTRQGAAVDLTYGVDFPDPTIAPGLVMEINALTGVQSVDLRSGASTE